MIVIMQMEKLSPAVRHFAKIPPLISGILRVSTQKGGFQNWCCNISILPPGKHWESFDTAGIQIPPQPLGV